MKLLFLDIDGVLNKPYIQERNSHGFLGICIVKTSYKEGLTEEKAQEVIRKLNK